MRQFIEKSVRSILENFQLALRFSFILTGLFVAIFFVARFTDLYKLIELRFLNYALIFPVGFIALKKATIMNDGYLEYFNGLMIAFLMVVLGQFWYAILFFAYLSVDHTVLNYLVNLMPQPIFYPKLSIFFVLIGEGLAAGAITSLTLMQYFKWKKGRWAVNA